MLYPLKPSFAGGELTPALYGRTDLQKYDVGAAILENSIVLRYGGVSSRPGFRYVAKTAGNSKARLIPFRYSTEQTFVLEFTPGKVRFFTQDGIVTDIEGNPIELATAYTAEEIPTIKYTQSADMLFVVQPNHAPCSITRYGLADWRLEPMNIELGPWDDPNRDDKLKLSASDVSGDITLTASADYFTDDMVGRTIRLGHTVPSQYKEGNPATGNLEVRCCPGGTVYVESFGFWNGNFTVERYDESAGVWVEIQTQSGNRSQNYNMKYTNDSDDIERYRVTSTQFDTSVWTGENEKQRGYIALQAFSKDHYGVVRILSVSSSVSAQAKVLRQLGDKTATNDFCVHAWGPDKGYPYCVGFFEDRLVFAGSSSKPQTYWASRSGDYFNYWVNVPQQDDDAITGTLSCGQMNGIKAMVPFSEMVMFTAGGEYKVGGGSEPFSPTNQQARPQEYRGINDLTPVVIGGRVVYVQHQGSIIRDLTYSYDVDKYTGDDISILAAHLFEGHTIIGMTYQQTPNSVVWCIRDDGIMLGMTYIKEQDVYAWHRHSTAGKFVDVCSVGGTDSDALWAVIERDGNYYVEQMASQVRNTRPDKQFYVDAGYMYEGEPVNTIEGLKHLAGKEVQVLADGNVLEGITIDNDGRLELPAKYSTIIVGLPYTMKIETLPIEINARDGAFSSRRERIARMMILFRDTRGGSFGINEKALDEIKWRASETYGSPIELFNGKKYVQIPQSSFLDTIQIIIKQEHPLPMTVLSIVPEVTQGG